jgi:hypothetical protein
MRRVLPAFLVYWLVTIALTYPLVLRLGSVFPHDYGDPALNTWILWWNTRAVPYTSAWWNAPAFYPLPGVLSFSENLLGLSLVTTPIQWLGGSALFAYNSVFLLTFPLCAIGAYLLALEITKRHDAAFVAGLLFGFAPYRMSHLPHVQVLAAFGMPFALVGLHRYLRDRRRRWLVLFGAAWLLQALCNGYYLLFFSTLVAMWMIWFTSPTTNPKAFRAIFLAGSIAALPLLPLLWQYQKIHDRLGFARDFGTTRHYGADALGLFSTDPTLAVWGWLQVYRRPEGQLFPGLTVVALLLLSVWLLRRHVAEPLMDTHAQRRWRFVRRALLVLMLGSAFIAATARTDNPWQVSLFGIELSAGNPVKPLTWAVGFGLLVVLTSTSVRNAFSRRSVLGFYAVAALVMWLLSLGPAPTLMGEPLLYRGPYALLMNLPGFSALRVPARFWMVSVLCLAIIGAILFDRLGSRFIRARRIIAMLVVIGALTDAWIWTFPLAVVPDVWRTQACIPPQDSQVAGAVMELPLGEIVPDVGAMYRSIGHARPTINGYSGYFPPHYEALRSGLALRDPDVLAQLAAHGLEYVVIDRGHESEGALRTYVAAQEGAELVCLQDAHAVFRLRGATAQPERVRTPLPVAAVRANVYGNTVQFMIDGDLSTRWETDRQATGMMLEIDLGESRPTSGVELSLGSSSSGFPRGLRIEASDDRTAWRQIWRGTSAGRAAVGAVLDPSVTPLAYDFSGVRTRYLRLSLTENDDAVCWSIAELKVLGL